MKNTVTKKSRAAELLESIGKKIPFAELPESMRQDKTGSYSTKIFAGIKIDGELHYQLDQCKQWQIDRTAQIGKLTETARGEDKYIGQFINESLPTLDDIEKTISMIKANLLAYIPDLEGQHPTIQIFAQIFLH